MSYERPLVLIVNGSVNSAITEANLDVTSELAEIRNWINAVICGQPRNSKACEICGYALAPYEMHHIGGRKHSDLLIKVCMSCHKILSQKQMMYDIRWLYGNQPDNIRRAFVLQGIYDILCLKAATTGNTLYNEIAADLPYKVFYLLGGLEKKNVL